MKHTIFSNQLLPWLLLVPPLAITFILFLWPAAPAIRQSFQRESAFGINSSFGSMANFTALPDSPAAKPRVAMRLVVLNAGRVEQIGTPPSNAERHDTLRLSATPGALHRFDGKTGRRLACFPFTQTHHEV